MPTPTPPNSRGLSYLTLDDFSPGIWSASSRALSGGVPAPKGAAQPVNTYRCRALPSHALGPLPAQTLAFALPTLDGAAINGSYLVTGLHQFGPLFPAANLKYQDEIHVGVEWVANAGPNQQKWRWFRVRMFEYPTTNPPTIDTVDTVDGSLNATPGTGWGMTFANSRMHPTDPTLVGVPIVVATHTGPTSKTDVFPPPAAPNTLAVYSLAPNRQVAVLSHQGRVVILEDIVFAHGSVGSTVTNEAISFTDPPNSITMGTQKQIFSQENPSGYVAWGSISAGELILFKAKGGAVLVMGDIAAPTVIALPGVVSPGMQPCRTASTTAGLLYIAKDNGAWSWNGGNASDPISQQLDDGVFAPSIVISALNSDVCAWVDVALFSNNYLYDIANKSWWLLDDPTVHLYRWFAAAIDGSILYAAPYSYTNAAPNGLFVFDRAVPATSFSWQSHPTTISQDRLVDAREVVVVAQGIGNVVVSLTDATGAVKVADTATFALLTRPKMVRVNMAAQVDNVTIRIVSTGTGGNPAPIVYSVAIGYRERMTANALV